MYGNTESLKDKASGVIQPGVHNVYFDKLEVEKIKTEKFEGEVVNITLKKDNGEAISFREFPFKEREGAKNGKGEVLTLSDQWKYYQDTHIATFKNAVASYDEMVEKLTSAVDFKTYIEAYKGALAENGGRKFEARIVSDKNGYSTYRFRFNSSAELGSNTVQFDEKLHGKPQKAATPEPITSGNGEENDLPF
jgi:uncharacterized membrane protein YkoI